jgi:4-hydroxy-tetrahydrodipicolinate reductase
MIRVGVLGAAGRMGQEVCRAVAATADLELAAAIDPEHVGDLVEGLAVSADADELIRAGVEVAVDFTHPSAAPSNVRRGLAAGIHQVVGTTGFTPEDLDEVAGLCAPDDAPNAVIAANFAIGAVLALRFAEQAARYLPDAEVIELHHPGKIDAPSGTALETARRISAARGPNHPSPPAGDDAHPGARGADVDGVRVHAVRLPGSVAHEEIIFGGAGETLSIRHDAIDRACFMPGVLLAIRSVAARRGLTLGLGPLLEDPLGPSVG